MKFWAGYLLVVAICFAAYYPMTSYGYTASDTLPLIITSRVESLSDLIDVISRPLLDDDISFPNRFYRPVSVVSFSIDYAIWKLNAFGYHFTDLILHVLSALLVCKIARIYFNDFRIAVAAASLFSIHPLMVEVVPAIARRQDTLSGLFLFASLYLFLRWFQEGRSRHVLVGSVICTVLATASKELSGYLPVVLVLHCLLFADDEHRVGRSKLALQVGVLYSLSIGAYLGLRFLVLGGIGGYQISITHWEVKYLIATYLPNFFYPQDFLSAQGVLSLTAESVLINGLIVVALLYFLRLAIHQGTSKEYVLLVSWLFLPLLVQVLTRTYSLRSSYTAIAPFSMLLSGASFQAVGHWIGGTHGNLWRRYASGLCSVLLLVLTLSIIAYSPLFHSYSHWQDSSKSVLNVLNQTSEIIHSHDTSGVSSLTLHHVPSLKDYYHDRVPRVKSVTYLYPWTVNAWLKHEGVDGMRAEIASYRQISHRSYTLKADHEKRGDVLHLSFSTSRVD